MITDDFTGLQRLLKGSPYRRTRLHSGRGELLPARRWGDVPLAFAKRMVPRDPVVPWMAPSAIAALDREIEPTMRILELGGGASTVWFAGRAKEVVCIEPSSVWAAQIEEHAAELGVAHKVTVVRAEIEEGLEVASNEVFDVGIDDFDSSEAFTRIDALAGLMKARCRLIVLDDSDVPTHHSAANFLPGYEQKRFLGFRSVPLQVTETSLFYRPVD